MIKGKDDVKGKKNTTGTRPTENTYQWEIVVGEKKKGNNGKGHNQ